MDESYFIESVRKPMDKVVKGALAPMPPTVPINDEELMALLAYVKSLSKKEEGIACSGSLHTCCLDLEC